MNAQRRKQFSILSTLLGLALLVGFVARCGQAGSPKKVTIRVTGP